MGMTFGATMRKGAALVAAGALVAGLGACGVDGPPRAPGRMSGAAASQPPRAPVTPGQTVSSEPLPVTVSGYATVGASYGA